jgi:hypothetical protein
MKKNILFSLTLLSTIAPLADAAPSWFKMLKLGSDFYWFNDHMSDLKKIFPSSNEKVDIEKLFSDSKSKVAQAQKISLQIKATKAMINLRLLSNACLRTRLIGHTVLAGAITFLTPLPIFATLYGIYPKDSLIIPDFCIALGTAVAGASSLCSNAVNSYKADTELRKKELTVLKDQMHKIESSLNSQLPEYLKGQGFPEKSIKATMSTINKPSFIQTMKQAAFNAIKR